MQRPDKPCVFCGMIAGTVPAQVVARSEHSLAVLDHRPLYYGHTLVVPLSHVPTLMDFPEEEMRGFFADVKRLSRAVEFATGADGIFNAINNRMSQSVPHLHVHVVPRKHKDNMRHFMWPRQKYPDEAAAEEVRLAISQAAEELLGGDEVWERMRRFSELLKGLPRTIDSEDFREPLERFVQDMRHSGEPSDASLYASRQRAMEAILADPELARRFIGGYVMR